MTSSLAAVALLLLGCAPGEAQANEGFLGKLTLTGSSTVAPLVLEISKRFEAEHPGVRIDVQTGGSSRGIADAGSGLADIGMASRALKPSETGLETHTIARDGVCVILHGSNPVGALSDDQVRAIYRGEIENWIELGGPDRAITVVNKASGRATLEVFLEHFDLEEPEIAADIVIGDNEQGIKTVAQDPGAIGYVSVGSAEYAAGAGQPLRLLPAAGVEATSANVASGDFPIGRPLNLVTSGALSELQRAFIDYCRSAHVHDLVRDLYFVPATGG